MVKINVIVKYALKMWKRRNGLDTVGIRFFPIFLGYGIGKELCKKCSKNSKQNGGRITQINKIIIS